MARPTFIILGQSNAEGVEPYTNLSDEDSIKYFGADQATLAAIPSPRSIEVSGVNFWTPMMPRAVTLDPLAGAATSTATAFHTTTSVAGVSPGDWLYYVQNTGAGQVARILTVTPGSPSILGLDRATSPAADGTTFAVYANSGSLDINSYQGSFRPMRYYVNGNADRFWFVDGYEYPNYTCRPLQHPGAYGFGGVIGPELELAYQLMRSFGEDINIIKLAIGSAKLARYKGPGLGFPAYSWFDGGYEMNDFHPSSSTVNPVTSVKNYDLYGILTDKIILPNASEIDVRGIFVKLGESETFSEDRAAASYDNMKLLRDSLRNFIATNGATTLAEKHIPFIVTGHNPEYWTYAPTFNANMETLAKEDNYTYYVNVNDLEPRTGDTAHLSADAYVELGKRFYEAFAEVVSDANVPFDSSAPTLADIRNRVKIRFERSSTANDSSDAAINQFINDSLREINNTLGDKAWYLRNSVDIPLSGWPNAITLPKYIRRVLRIEHPSRPGVEIPWKLIGYAHDSAPRIVLASPCETSSGTVHYIRHFPEIVDDDQFVQMPEEYCELLVLLTCQRMAESYGNQHTLEFYARKVMELWKYVKRDCQRHMDGRLNSMMTYNTYDNWTGSSFPNWMNNL